MLADRPEILPKAREMGFRLIAEQRLAALDLSILRLRTPLHVDEQMALAMLRGAFPQLTADVNSLYTPYSTQSEQIASLPAPDYARKMIGWTAGESCGAGLRIGMIDMAPGPSPALSGQKLHQRSFLDDGEQAADSGHGTAIASLLVGHGLPGHTEASGLLPAAELYAAAVFAREGNRSEASAFAIAGALDWMAANHVRVVNISLSGTDNRLLDIAVQRAAAKGTLLVAAAGNGGAAAPPAFPAALPDVIAVTAVDQDGRVYAKANHGRLHRLRRARRWNLGTGARCARPVSDGDVGGSTLHHRGRGTGALERRGGKFRGDQPPLGRAGQGSRRGRQGSGLWLWAGARGGPLRHDGFRTLAANDRGRPLPDNSGGNRPSPPPAR